MFQFVSSRNIGIIYKLLFTGQNCNYPEWHGFYFTTMCNLPCSFLFDVNSQAHKYYKNLIKCLRGDQTATDNGTSTAANTSGETRKRKRKSRWECQPKSASSSSSNVDEAVAAALAAEAEFEHSIPMSNKEEEERQRQVKEQHEVRQII